MATKDTKDTKFQEWRTSVFFYTEDTENHRGHRDFWKENRFGIEKPR